MPQKRTFYLYEAGEPTELLTLGSLILHDYKNPLLTRHYSHAELSADDKKALATSEPIENACFSYKRGWSPGVSLEAAELVNFDLCATTNGEKRVVAKTGQRIQLKKPETFFEEYVLKEPTAAKALKLWLSAAKSDYMLQMKWIRKPKIWMLTGQYLLDNAKSVLIYNHEETGKAGVSSVAVGALTGIPLGGSIRLGHNSKIRAVMEMPGQNVWAARYHLVDTSFVKLNDGQTPQLPASITLHPDVTSLGNAGYLRSLGEDEVVGIWVEGTKTSPTQGIQPPAADEKASLEVELLDEYEETEAYENDLEAAIEKFETILSRAEEAARKKEAIKSERKGMDDEGDEGETY